MQKKDQLHKTRSPNLYLILLINLSHSLAFFLFLFFFNVLGIIDLIKIS